MNNKYLVLALLSSVAVTYAAMTSSIMPTGAGTYSSWTPSTGSTHYTLVDESACNGTTDYVSTTAAGNRDSYAISVASVPNGSSITGISITPCASKDATSGTANMSVFYRLNGVNSADGAAYALTGKTPVSLSSTDYTGLSVTKDASTTLEIGAVRVSGTTGARLSRIATVITYITTPATPLNAVAVATSSNSIAFTWQDSVGDQDGFSVERSTDGTNFSAVATTTKFDQKYIDSALTSGTYYYKVRAYNVVGYSAYSTTTSAMIP